MFGGRRVLILRAVRVLALAAACLVLLCVSASVAATSDSPTAVSVETAPGHFHTDPVDRSEPLYAGYLNDAASLSQFEKVTILSVTDEKMSVAKSVRPYYRRIPRPLRI